MCQSCRVPLCPDPVWPVGTGLHGTQSPLQPQKHSVFNNWVLCKTLYDLWVQVFMVLNSFCNHTKKNNSVFNNWMSFRMPLCQDAVWLVDTRLHGTPVSSTATKTCDLTTGCHAKPCMTRSGQYFMVPHQPQKRKRKKGVFNH